MTTFESALLPSLIALAAALTAWIRAEVANKRVKGKQDKPGA